VQRYYDLVELARIGGVTAFIEPEHLGEPNSGVLAKSADKLNADHVWITAR
jgi:hypothetical protein